MPEVTIPWESLWFWLAYLCHVDYVTTNQVLWQSHLLVQTGCIFLAPTIHEMTSLLVTVALISQETSLPGIDKWLLYCQWALTAPWRTPPRDLLKISDWEHCHWKGQMNFNCTLRLLLNILLALQKGIPTHSDGACENVILLSVSLPMSWILPVLAMNRRSHCWSSRFASVQSNNGHLFISEVAINGNSISLLCLDKQVTLVTRD